MSLLGLLQEVGVWVTVRWHDTVKKLRQRLSLIFTHIKIIPRYSKTLSLSTGRSFSSFACKKNFQKQNQKLWNMLNLPLLSCFYHFMQIKQNWTVGSQTEAEVKMSHSGDGTDHCCIHITQWTVIKVNAKILPAHQLSAVKERSIRRLPRMWNVIQSAGVVRRLVSTIKCIQALYCDL